MSTCTAWDGQGAPVLVGAVGAAPRLRTYAGRLMVMDGSYLKAVEPEAEHAYGVVWMTTAFCGGLGRR